MITEIVKEIEKFYLETKEEVKEKLEVDEKTAERITYHIMLNTAERIGNI